MYFQTKAILHGYSPKQITYLPATDQKMFMGHQKIQLNHKQQITKHHLRKNKQKNYSSFFFKRL